MRASKSQVRRTSGRSPSPSPPTTRRDAGRRQLEVEQAPDAAGTRPTSQKPGVFQALHRPDQVRDPGDRQAEQGPGRGAPTTTEVTPTLPVLGQDDPADPGRAGGAQDRAQVPRVLDAVEHEHARAPAPRDLLEVRVAERRRERDGALVPGRPASRSSAARSASIARHAAPPRRRETLCRAAARADAGRVRPGASLRSSSSTGLTPDDDQRALGCSARVPFVRSDRPPPPPMGKILHRYIFRESRWRRSLLGLGVFTFVLLIARLLKLIELVVNRGPPADQVLRLFGYLMPAFLEVTVPMAMLLAILVAFGRLSADAEMIAHAQLGR